MSSDIFEARYRQIASQGREAWFDEAIYDELVRHWQTHVAPAEPGRNKLLEIGCGVGRLIPVFQELGFEVSGADISPLAIQAAQGTYPDLDLRAADITAGLPWGPETFDVAIDSDCLHHIPNPGRKMFLAEAHRVLRPGGVLHVKTNIGQPDEALWETFAYDPETRTTRIDGQVSNYFAEPEELKEDLEKAGFQITREEIKPAAPSRSAQMYLNAKRKAV